MNFNITERLTITVTAKAVEKILNLMSEGGLENHYLRLFVESIGCSGPQFGMAFSEKSRDDDIALYLNGVRALVDNFSLIYLDGARVDYIDTPDGNDFVIDNPSLAPNSACHSCGKNCD